MFSFFNATDEAIAHELDKELFYNSLLYNILFKTE